MIKLQSLNNKKGEVVFRKRLYRSLPPRQSLLKLGSRLDEEKIHQKNSREAFKKLEKMEIPMSFYVDLGAGSCLRSLVLENEFNGKGVAGDISLDAIKFTNSLAKRFRYRKIPFRVVLDIYHLPFKNDSLPFIIIFQTLHHLPDPLPVLLEIKRVLADGGYVYIGEEPIKQTLNLNLWRRGRQRTPLEKILMAIGILPFITTIGKEEVEYGILEESFSLKQWQKWLAIFDKVETEIIPFKLGPRSNNLSRPSLLTKFFLFLLGGGINALCQVEKDAPGVKPTDISQIFACPGCSTHPPLEFRKKKNYYVCNQCKNIYRKRQGILFLLPKELEKQLYE